MGKDDYLERARFQIDDLLRKIQDAKQRLKDLENERDLLIKGLQQVCPHNDFIQQEGSNERRCEICDLTEIAETPDSFKILNKGGTIMGPMRSHDGTPLPFGMTITHITKKN